MKTYIVPYIVPSANGWWAGIDIFNTGQSSVAEVNVYNAKGALVNTFDKQLGAFESVVLTPDELSKALKDEGRAKVLIVGESLCVTPLQGCGGEGFGVMPVIVEDGVKKP